MSDNEKKEFTDDFDRSELIADILNAKNKKDRGELAAEKPEFSQPDEVIEETSADNTPDDAFSDISSIEVKPDAKPPRKRRKKRRRKNTGKAVFRIILFTVIVLVAGFLAVTILSIGSEVMGLNRPDAEIIVEIKEGDNVDDIAQTLYEQAVVDRPWLFSVISKMNHASNYIAGKHEINMNMSYNDIIEALQQPAIQERVSVDVTFPEGYTLEQCADVLEQAGVCGAQEFIEAFNAANFGYNFEKNIEYTTDKYYKMEGYCFPDTYTFFTDSDPDEVARKICANFAEKVNANMLGRMEEMGLTIDETIALASIVQKEAGSTREMKMVASVFWNRLNNSEEFPKLQSDPTIKYANAVGIELYDTYKSEGIPPGAICNPGIDAIEAVLYPEDSDYYFFCSNLSTGEFYYAETLAGHEKNLVVAGLV